MALKKVARIGDTAVGHTAYGGGSVIGTIISASSNVKNGGIGVANADSFVYFPPHPHADEGGNVRSHTIKITATGKHKVNGFNIAVHGDTVAVADEAGGNATIVGTTNNLFCV